MAFTGKATYGAGSGLPELVEDVSDIVGIVSPYETPLLDRIGDPSRAARSTLHSWIEDSLLPNTDAVNQTVFTPDAESATTITVDNGDRFRVGDQVRPEGLREVLLVTGISGDDLTVVRGYGGTTAGDLANNMVLTILGNAALEGDDRPATRFTNRTRRTNYTQIFAASVEVSGSMQAARSHGIADEMDYQKQERLRELMRDLENCVINGVAPSAAQEGSGSVRRTMDGIVSQVTTNQFTPGLGPIPVSGGTVDNALTEPMLNAALRAIWETSGSPVDTLVVGGAQKRAINSFISSDRRYASGDDRISDMVSVYESDFGTARIVLSRWVPADTILLLDSTRIEVPPLEGRSFHFKELASSGDAHVGMVIGEYTLALRNEVAHGVLSGLAV